MLSILILVTISVISPAKSITVEFKVSDFKADLDILWKYYRNGGEKNIKAYIDIPNVTFAVKSMESKTEIVLAMEGTFIKGNPPAEYYDVIAVRRGKIYSYFLADDNTFSNTSVYLTPDTRLRYDYAQEIIKEPPYIAIRYASMEEIRTEIDNVFQDIDINKKYYSQPTYTISHGSDGHFIQYVESSSLGLIQGLDLDIVVLFGSTDNGDNVVTVTSTTTKPFLLHDVDANDPLYNFEGSLGIRMATIGVLAKRDRQNEVSLFTVDNYDYETMFIDISYKDIVSDFEISGWSDCFVEDPPSRLEKGFKVVIKGYFFIKRCGFPIDSNGEEVKQDGRKIIIDIAITNAKAKFTRFYKNMSRSSSQIFVDKDKKLYMIANNTQLLIDNFVNIRYSFE